MNEVGGTVCWRVNVHVLHRRRWEAEECTCNLTEGCGHRGELRTGDGEERGVRCRGGEEVAEVDGRETNRQDVQVKEAARRKMPTERILFQLPYACWCTRTSCKSFTRSLMYKKQADEKRTPAEANHSLDDVDP